METITYGTRDGQVVHGRCWQWWISTWAAEDRGHEVSRCPERIWETYQPVGNCTHCGRPIREPS